MPTLEEYMRQMGVLSAAAAEQVPAPDPIVEEPQEQPQRPQRRFPREPGVGPYLRTQPIPPERVEGRRKLASGEYVPGAARGGRGNPGWAGEEMKQTSPSLRETMINVGGDDLLRVYGHPSFYDSHLNYGCTAEGPDMGTWHARIYAPEIDEPRWADGVVRGWRNGVETPEERWQKLGSPPCGRWAPEDLGYALAESLDEIVERWAAEGFQTQAAGWYGVSGAADRVADLMRRDYRPWTVPELSERLLIPEGDAARALDALVAEGVAVCQRRTYASQSSGSFARTEWDDDAYVVRRVRRPQAVVRRVPRLRFGGYQIETKPRNGREWCDLDVLEAARILAVTKGVFTVDDFVDLNRHWWHGAGRPQHGGLVGRLKAMTAADGPLVYAGKVDMWPDSVHVHPLINGYRLKESWQ